jgi:uncharacterized protein YciI
MSYFAVVREAGPGWSAGKGIAGQPSLDDHSEFITGLAGEGFVLVAGPLSGSEAGDIRALLIVNAESKAAVDGRLADDPWARDERLVTVSVEPWNVFVGEDRLADAVRL